MIGTEGDRTQLQIALRENGGFHYATEWFMRGWIPLPYQYAYHHVVQKNTTWLAGIAAGKTAGSAASCLIDCLSIPYFKALNTSVTARQAELPFDMVMSWIEGNNKLDRHIYDIKLRPWPIIYFQNFSVYEFRTAGTDARFIRGTEYDRIVYDEAGLDGQGAVVKVLRGRLRGTRPNQTKRMSRMDIITSPTDAPWLRDRYYWGLPDSDDARIAEYISFKTRTRDNTRLTEEQIHLMEVEYTDEMIAVEMDAEFPDYGMSLFPKRHIRACTSQVMNDLAYISLNPEDPKKIPEKGYVWDEHPRYGPTKFEFPYDPRGRYVLAGDPGLDNPPKRNAPAVGVLRVDTTPKQLVYFDWVFSRGSYMPFLHSYKYAIEKYNPEIRALDTTATQKGLQELGFEQLGIATSGINFQKDKQPALNSLSLALSNHDLAFPLVKGLDKQLSIYTHEDDKKIPQDIVMMMAMLTFASRFTTDGGGTPATASRARRSRKVRSRRKHR